MLIKKAEENNIDRIMEIYASARQYMAQTGNVSQWGDSYPPKELLLEDINKHQCYVGLCDDGEIHCVFVFFPGEDPIYHVIEGSWLNDRQYDVIHRIASDGTYHGIFKECIDYCKERSNNLKMDTHTDNKTMQHLLVKNDFTYCGVIHLENGSSRIAYQYTNNKNE